MGCTCPYRTARDQVAEAKEAAPELKVCPFCGGSGQIVDDLIDPENESSGYIFHAVCENDTDVCPMQPGIYACDSADAAAKVWNTRADLATTADAIWNQAISIASEPINERGFRMASGDTAQQTIAKKLEAARDAVSSVTPVDENNS